MTHSTTETRAFQNLSPDTVLNAIEAHGYRCNGHLLALNSYENRVYQIGLENAAPVVAKFYRPERWSDAAILEEHAFAQTLAHAELPVVAALEDDSGAVLHHHTPHRFSIYPRRGGRAPDLDDGGHLQRIGRFLGQMHLLGESGEFSHRRHLDIAATITQSSAYLLENSFLPAALISPCETLVRDLLQRIQRTCDTGRQVTCLRIHGDFHPGNILWRDEALNIVDLDDCCTGPAVQDLWMLLSGDRAYQTARLAELLSGYHDFRTFNPHELHLIEALRTMRILSYAAWLARRMDDPAFQQAFPWFGSARYWDELILTLREQMAALEEPPLEWDPRQLPINC